MIPATLPSLTCVQLFVPSAAWVIDMPEGHMQEAFPPWPAWQVIGDAQSMVAHEEVAGVDELPPPPPLLDWGVVLAAPVLPLPVLPPAAVPEAAAPELAAVVAVFAADVW